MRPPSTQAAHPFFAQSIKQAAPLTELLILYIPETGQPIEFPLYLSFKRLTVRQHHDILFTRSHNPIVDVHPKHRSILRKDHPSSFGDGSSPMLIINHVNSSPHSNPSSFIPYRYMNASHSVPFIAYLRFSSKYPFGTFRNTLGPFGSTFVLQNAWPISN